MPRPPPRRPLMPPWPRLWPPRRWKPPPPKSKALPPALPTELLRRRDLGSGRDRPILRLDGYCLARQVAMSRGLNCTHRELSLTRIVVLVTRRPPALAGP